MSLQLRRGTDAERLTITPVVGEIIYVTDTKKTWVGDGSTVGGVEIGSTAPVDSVAGRTGAVVIVKSDIADFGTYATTAQGTLADSATQPADNISTLTNDSAFADDQTGAEIKAAYEAEANTNAFTDANVTTLGTALQDVTGESIKDLSDVFSSMTPADGEVLTFDTTNGWQAEATAAVPATFTDLTDTPGTLTGQGSLLVRVNAGETALEFVAAGTPTLPTTTKGDLIVHNGSIDVREAIGTNDQILTADSTQASGMKWADAAGGGGGHEWIVTGSSGSLPVSTGNDSMSIGYDSTAGATTASVVMGDLANTSGAGCVVVGFNAKSAGSDNVVIGNSAGQDTASCDWGVFIGKLANSGSTSKDHCIAIGNGAEGETEGIAIGSFARGGDNSIIIGRLAGDASKNNSVAIGDRVVALAHNQLRIGTSNTHTVNYESSKLTLTGTEAHFVIPPYVTGSRPASPSIGSNVFDTTLSKPIWYNGTNWVDATGTTV